MKTAESLRTELGALYEQLKNGQIEHKNASELTNIAGKMISSAMAQLKYYGLRKETPSIEFLDSSTAASEPPKS